MYFNEDTNGRMMFDLVIESYDSARPTYPAKAMDEIFSRFPTKPRALEIGSGSGQATTDLEHYSLSVDCVEPGANFSRHLRMKYASNTDVSVYECDFEDFEASGPYDLIFSGCALHWVPKDVALTKAASLLRENGWLAGIWNMLDFNPEVLDLVNETLVPQMPEFDLPIFRDEHRERFAAGVCDLCESYEFQDSYMEIYEELRTLALGEFVDLVKSYCDIEGWESGEVDQLFAGLRNTLRNSDCEILEVQNYYPMALAKKRT